MFSSLRLSILPINEINDAIAKKGLVYEVGSGYGVLAAFLAQTVGRSVVGIDFDADKTNRARNSLPADNLSFVQADALTYRYKRCTGVILSDFLHHITYSNQEKLLKSVTDALESDGVLVIKEIDKGESFRASCSRLWDLLLYPRDRIYYRTQKDWSTTIKSLGFTVTTKRLVRWFPGSTTLFICTKKKRR